MDNTTTAPTETQLATTNHRPLLMEKMASQYGMEPAVFKNVLLKTVFPQDKVVSMEQLAMFVIVAHNYSLNPLLREIYAFPSKGGGIIPVLGYDGWVTIIQRQPDYDGCEYEYIWKNNEPGGEILGVTCIIYRKKHSRPTKKTVWFKEVKRDTDQWKQKPVWMTEIKSLIQTARLAYGFGGIYDQDEAENILEAQLKQGTDGVMRSEIKMPQRSQPVLTSGTITNVGQGVITIDSTTVPNNQPVVFLNRDMPGETVVVERRQVEPLIEAEMVTEEAQTEETGEDRTFFAGISDMAVEETPAEQTPVTEPEPATKRKTIGAGHARRIHAIINTKKTRSDKDLEELKKTYKIDSLNDFPIDRYPELEKWAEGK